MPIVLININSSVIVRTSGYFDYLIWNDSILIVEVKFFTSQEGIFSDRYRYIANTVEWYSHVYQQILDS